MNDDGGGSPPARERVDTDGPVAGGVADVYGATVDDYVAFAGTTLSVGVEAPEELEVLGRFVDTLASGSLVLDVGAGPGRASAWIADRRGADAVALRAVEPSPLMVMAARRLHPWLESVVGWVDTLPVPDGTVDAVVAWYSVIHTPPAELPAAWREWNRVLGPGGRVVLAFQAGGGEIVRRDVAGAELVSYRHDPETVAAGLRAAGFDVAEMIVRPARHTHEDTPQTVVVATRS